ncbi:Uma2 family endonuclease [Ancylothrix sp. C2]|uniref:Uma2 family endonuclease n=1 Tax=Ancylothrix sp. D3o TaxID=2953691 RepID=UPI0021BA72BA|nr:Uma2 family endonuclease [Ancylothrix sp. D3o]MCT7948598.1 Uma2 family endonuclease [Ancylothrix sp. D3o]
MFIPKNNFYISPADYLEAEQISPIKHEYRRGHVYAMTGAKNPHVVIAGNLVRRLGNHLDESNCIVLTSDTKVRLEEANCYYYPDVAVTCDQRDTTSTDDFIRYPVLIVEVLSRSTENFDRTEKFADYQTCSTLREYVLVSQNQMKVECFRLDESGNWNSQIYEKGSEVYLESVDFQVSITDIYQKVAGLI